MRPAKIGIWLALLVASTTPASPWAYQGHQLIGSIADQLLNDHARREVAKALGFSPEFKYPLMVAATWADCVRGVTKTLDGESWHYRPQKLEYRIPCTTFETDDELERMTDYVRRNSKPGASHTSFHFADVTIQHDDYDLAYHGTSKHDVVAAINATIDKLKGRKAPEDFNIRDAKEAILLLAHFVGDIHQPLHVGAIYLDKDGTVTNPDEPSQTGALETAGGNFLIDGQVDLHTEWDAIPLNLGVIASGDLVAKAKAVPATPDAVEKFAAVWAGESIRLARSAFQGVTFSPAPEFDSKNPRWLITFENDQDYWKRQDTLKRDQLAKAGARLAQLLNAIWP